MLAATVFTVRVIRRKKWEFFKYPHFLLIFFLIFGALHEVMVIYFCLPGIALYILDIFVREFRKFFRTSEIVEIDTQYPEHTIFKLRVSRFKYQPGQFLTITIPAMSYLQSHPFTISSSPMEELITIHAKSLGQWSREIQTLTTESKIWVNGPYGIKPSWRKYEVVLLFSGGIGATPWVSLLRDFIMRKDAKHKPKHMYFYCCFRTREELNVFSDTWALVRTSTAVRVEKYITQSDAESREEEMAIFKKPKDPHFHAGRPDFEGIFDEICRKHKVQNILAMVCGPGNMARFVQEECYSHSRYNGTIFDYHHEIFKL